MTHYNLIKMMYGFKIREKLDLTICNIPQIYQKYHRNKIDYPIISGKRNGVANTTTKYHYDKRYKFLIFVSGDFTFLRFYNDYF
jgi:hypothetical protein